MSSSSSYSNNITNSSTRQSHRRAHPSSSMNLIDLTVPSRPRILHPSTLPSQDTEIIEIDSEEDEPRSNIHHWSDDEEIEFLGETPAAGSSSSSQQREPSRPPPQLASSLHDTPLFRYLYGQDDIVMMTTPASTRAAEQEWGSFMAANNTLTSTEPTASIPTGAPEGRRPLPERIQSSGIWNITPRPTTATYTEETAPRQRNHIHEMTDNSPPDYNLFGWGPHEYFHPYRQRRQPPRSSGHSWLSDDIGILSYIFGFGARSDPQESTEQSEAQQDPEVPARIGHTKVISQNIIVACPICKNEFGHENENTKLWVVVGCGHVICGDCVDGVFLSKVALKVKAPKKPKTKGKARWEAPVEQEEPKDQDAADHNEVSPHETNATDTPGSFKLVKKAMGVCPSCSRKIKKTSVQQLYL